MARDRKIATCFWVLYKVLSRRSGRQPIPAAGMIGDAAGELLEVLSRPEPLFAPNANLPHIPLA